MKKNIKTILALIMSAILVMLSVTIAFSILHDCDGDGCQICLFIGNVSRLIKSLFVPGVVLSAVITADSTMSICFADLQNILNCSLVSMHMEMDN